MSLPQWLDRCWEQSLVSGGAAGRFQLLTEAQFRLVSRDIIEDMAGHRLTGPGIERLVRQSRAVCAQWGIGARDLRAAATGPDTAFFADWAERFQAICAERSWVDVDGLSALLLPEFDSSPMIAIANRLVLAGFDSPSAAEMRLFEQLEKSGGLTGRLVSTPPAQRSSGSMRFARPADERRAAARWARAQLETQPDASVGIVVPNLSNSPGAYRREFLDVFDPHWRERDDALHPVSVSDGRRLADSGIVRTALLLLRVPSGRLDFTELGWLLRSPFVGDWQYEIEARSRFDLRIRQDGLQTVNLLTLRKRFCSNGQTGPEKFLGLIDALLGLADSTRAVDEPTAWTRVIDRLLKAAGFCRGRALCRRDDTTVRQWERLLDGFAALGAVTGKMGFRRALSLLADAAREQPYAGNDRADGVHLVTPTDARGIDFDAVWICGMTSAAWPGDIRSSPLIPLGLQRDRGIPEAVPELYRARSLELLRSLLDGTPQSVASWSEQDGEETLLPSPLIAHLSPLDSRQPDSEPGTGPGGPLPRALVAVDSDEPPPVTAEEQIRGGSRLLTLQSVCPARAFFELRLGAKEMPIPPFALDAMTRGSLVHDAAEYFYAELGDTPTTAATGTVDAAIDTAIARALDRHVPPMHPLAKTLRETEQPRLGSLLRNLIDYDRTRGSFTILNIEKQQAVTVNGVELTVRFDRVDADDKGGRLVIDYKTGGKFSASNWFGERPLEMQMPLYAAYGAFDGIALYWMHAAGLSVTGMGDRDWGTGRIRSFQTLSPENWHARVSAWRVTCERLMAEFRSGDCRIDVANDAPATRDYAMLTRRWMLRVDAGQESS